jgi:hypothetical protein
MSKSSDTISPHWLPCLLALAALVLVWCRFAPPLVEWRALDSPAYYNLPATHRAHYVVRQVNEPFAPVSNVSNRVVKWRLLLPVATGLVPRMPERAVLWFSMFGVVAAVIAWSAVLQRSGLSPPAVTASCILFASTGAVLTGMHWLSYADGWILAGLLAVAVGPRSLLITAALCCPWIDERFVLLAPLALLIRSRSEPDVFTLRSPQLQPVAVGCGAYLMIRGVAAFTGNDVSGDYLGRMAADWQGLGSPMVLAQATWHSLRVLWLPVLLGAGLLAGTGSPRQRKFAVAILLWTILVSSLLAGDLSRSLSFLAILAIPALKHLAQRPRLKLAQILVAGAAMQLIVPVAHVGLGWQFPAKTLVHELQRLRKPPAILTGSHHLDLAVRALQANDPASARALALAAGKLSPNDPQIAAGVQAVLNRTNQ